MGEAEVEAALAQLARCAEGLEEGARQELAQRLSSNATFQTVLGRLRAASVVRE
jgi:hypothetical protein